MAKIRRLLNKEIWNEVDTLQFILECSASSARFGTINEYENEQVFTTRANIHAMLILPFGSGKTSSFIQIKDAVKVYDITFPGVIGSVNQNGEFIESSIIKAGGKVLVIDEFQRLNEGVKNALNSILEYPHTYSRTLGYKIRGSVRKRGKFYRIKAKQNTNQFDVYSKFSCIAGGMYASQKTTISKAWFSRFIPIRFSPSIEYFEKLSRGEKSIRINPEYKELSFEFPDYLKFNQIYWKTIKRSPFMRYFTKTNRNESGYLIRLFQDLVRIGAVIASLEDRQVVTPEDCELPMNRLVDFILTSYTTSTLDEYDIFIVNNLTRLKQTEIAEMLGITPSAVAQRVSKLRRLGVIW